MCSGMIFEKNCPVPGLFPYEKRNMESNGQRRENAENIPQTSAVYGKFHPLRGKRNEIRRTADPGMSVLKEFTNVMASAGERKSGDYSFHYGRSSGDREILTELRELSLNSVFLWTGQCIMTAGKDDAFFAQTGLQICSDTSQPVFPDFMQKKNNYNYDNMVKRRISA